MLDEPERMQSFAQSVSVAFKLHVLTLLLARSADDAEGVRAALAAIREKLDALEVLLGDGGTAAVSAGATARAPAGDGDAADGADYDEIGRNQRSRLREITLLETLAGEARPFPLGQLMRALEERGFPDGNPAVVSHLHRMKKLGVIDQPANGMYEITPDGLGHLRKLRSSFGALLRERNETR